MSMPEMNTTSAHSRSAGSSGRRFKSQRRTSQLGGKRAATVSRPSGGSIDFLPVKAREYSAPQYVLGKEG
jgi:hypothetical protein